ncbi:zona pellucida sperm-binding protein 1-like [Cyclopterus lumpus]|uniref:zona pellucida sperm-binding protein 1-like n=1 Tax=Cyclopterus lumpus TaxID=8103 RepID=UPI0014869665|nr:zona pellucida sperm-binding protein 1-like [Cyclopterus lumpus]
MHCHGEIVAVLAQHCGCFSPVPRGKAPAQLAMPDVTCFDQRIRAVFGPLVKSNIHVQDRTGALIPVLQSDGFCGLKLGRDKNQNLSFFSRYDGCYAQIKGGNVVVPLQVQLLGRDRWLRVNISCPLTERPSERTRLLPTPLPGSCDTEGALQLDCGPRSISRDACHKLGCCYDARKLTCYYKLNACSLDGHVVFSVNSTVADRPLDPSGLIVNGLPQCSPAATTPDAAIFKIGIMDCGAKMKVDGDVQIFEVEVEELQTENGTQHYPFRVNVQCEFEAFHVNRTADQPPFPVTNPPPVIALGTMRVQMRIATDASFTSFFPEDQLPIALPLRKVVYVEVSIAQPSPDPTLSLRMRDCFAYPASRHSVWRLLQDGCPNPLDNNRSSIHVSDQGETTALSQVRRFDVKTFAFLDPHTGHPSVEEVYFYCWVELCTNGVECAQPCSIVPSEGERQRREATSKSDQVQLVFLGPLLLGQNATELEDNQCMKKQTMFQVTVYILSAVSVALFLILMFSLSSSIGRRQKPEAPHAVEAQVDKLSQ